MKKVSVSIHLITCSRRFQHNRFDSIFCSWLQILNTPRIQQLVTGAAYVPRDEKHCTSLNSINTELNSIIYKSMINSFLQSVKGYSFDVTEIMRLSRLLWPEFVSALDEKGITKGNSNDKTNKEDRTNTEDIKDGRTKECQRLIFHMMSCLKCDNSKAYESCTNFECILCRRGSDNENIKLSDVKSKLSEKLDHNIRETVRALMANVLLMPGRVIEQNIDKPFASRLPYNTKFLLLAAFLCTQKRQEHDVNLFTTVNTGKRSNRGSKNVDEGTAYASLNQLRAAKIPSFLVERLFSVYTAIIGQYGSSTMNTITLGTEELFKYISALIAGGLLQPASNATVTAGVKRTDFMLQKFSCTLSRADADVIASDVGFPLSRYCS